MRGLMRRSHLAGWALAASLGALAQPPLTLPTPAELRHTVEVLAEPELTGRRSGTPGGDRAAREIARWLAAAGLGRGGDDREHRHQ
jgi:hypothetical protein